MRDRTPVIKKVEEMIDRLSKPLPQSEIDNGWSDEARQALRQTFEDLRKRLLSAEPLTDDEKRLSLSRGMDTWGITGGDLMAEADTIDMLIRELEG